MPLKPGVAALAAGSTMNAARRRASIDFAMGDVAEATTLDAILAGLQARQAGRPDPTFARQRISGQLQGHFAAHRSVARFSSARVGAIGA